MRLLKKLLLAVASLIVLAILKIVFAKHLPVAALFYVNLLGSLQFLILLWAVLTGLLEIIFWTGMPQRVARRNSFIAFLLFVTVAEIIFAVLFHHPSSIPLSWRGAFRYYYNMYDRNILQYDPKIAVYDDKLFYRLRPDNRCLFRNIEFADSIFTNDMGFRNARLSPDSVGVICLGDSYTVGWGVGQEQAYPQQLQKIIGTPVLNTGVSSYGTAREVESIRRPDMRAAGTIVIQYCNNDADENEAWLKNGRRLVISSERMYNAACSTVRWSRFYFPGKYFCTLSKLLLKGVKDHIMNGLRVGSGKRSPGEPDPVALGEHDARNFLEVLKSSGWDFDRTQVIVYSMDEADTSIALMPALSRQLRLPENIQAFKGHVHLLSVAPLLDESDYYILDAHLRASGQRKIAKAVAGAIRSLY